MNNQSFHKTYPNINVRSSRGLAKDKEADALAISNIQHIFIDTLPEEWQIILNQRGMDIQLSNDINECNITSQKIHLFKFLPSFNFFAIGMKLDRTQFSQFKYMHGIPIDDWQRASINSLQEECAHALFVHLAMSPKWIRAVQQDMVDTPEQINSKQNREWLMYLYRQYNSIENTTKESGPKNHKVDLSNYPLTEIPAELCAEIIHCRNFLLATQKYGGKNLFPPTAQQALDSIELSTASDSGERKTIDWDNAPDSEKHKAVDAILTMAFPHSYPIFQDYENRLKLLAGDIQRDPDSYFGLRAHIGDYTRKLLHPKQPSKWNERFSDFFSEQTHSSGHSR